ncbi:MAG TPA: CDGSH iron-sulfur domain-containing protein [Thermomicrobiales bacterium]|nr:CDGSH iron-sulfur domain-containing protein [Thermomicrobiales bacterium]
MTDQARITPTKNGPYHITGSFEVVMPDGAVLETEGETWLCRCGHSGNKPFCDGTHRKIGFKAGEEAAVKQKARDAQAAAQPAVGGYQPVGAPDDFAEGEIRGVEVGGEAVVVGRVAGELYAIGGICTHQHARLEDGELDGAVVMCPLHNSGFDIRTGEAVRLPATEPEPRYEVRVQDGQVFVATRPVGGTGG